MTMTVSSEEGEKSFVVEKCVCACLFKLQGYTAEKQHFQFQNFAEESHLFYLFFYSK